MKTLLLLFGLLLFPQEKKVDYYLVYADSYRSNTEIIDKVSIVLVFKKDSVRTYIAEVGYVWWKVNSHYGVRVHPDRNVLYSGTFELSYGKHHSRLLIYGDKTVQLIYLVGNPPIVITIEMKRRNINTSRK